MLIPYEHPLTDLAKDLRERHTRAEQILWRFLRRRQLLGYRFLRQKPLLSYIADFYCHELSLVIELDGKIHDHRKQYDEYRTRELQAIGLTVIRYTNNQIIHQLPRTLIHLKKVIQVIKKPPQQDPSLKERG